MSVVRSFNGLKPFKSRLFFVLSESFSSQARLFREIQNYSKLYDRSSFLPSFSSCSKYLGTNHTEMRKLHCFAVKQEGGGGERQPRFLTTKLLCISFVHFLSLSVSRAPRFSTPFFTTFHSANDTIEKVTIELHFLPIRQNLATLLANYECRFLCTKRDEKVSIVWV